MKRWLWGVLCLCLLTGCAQNPKEVEQGLKLRSQILQGNGCSFQADITADYGDKLNTFSVACEADREGNLNFTVTKPASISGITGSIQKGEGYLTFDDIALQFAPMTDDQITPVLSPWIFIKTLRSGYLTSAGKDGDFLRLTIDDSYEEDALTLDIWLGENQMPVRAEILYDSRRILSMEVRDFAIL